jgi:hypothetical protein
MCRRQIRRTVTAWIGLFALLLQLFMSFGHFHRRDFLAPRAASGSTTAILAPNQPSSRQEQSPSRLPDNDCPICSAMHIAASGLLPAPPLVASPAEFSQVSLQFFIERFSFGVSRHLLFQTRAPPIA